jgi:hypothetical protein
MSLAATDSACFLAAGIVSALGIGITANLAALQNAPTPPQLLPRTLGSAQETVPYKLLADVALTDIETRLSRSLDLAIQQALDGANLSTRERREMGLFVGSSSFDISVSEHCYQQARLVSGAAIPLDGSPSFRQARQHGAQTLRTVQSRIQLQHRLHQQRQRAVVRLALARHRHDSPCTDHRRGIDQ